MDDKFSTPPPDLTPHLRELFDRVIAKAPPYSTRRSFVEFVREQLGIDYSYRTVETWTDLPLQYIGGKATFPTIDGLRRVFAELNSRPVVVGVRAACATDSSDE
jgi:hypothetical protein